MKQALPMANLQWEEGLLCLEKCHGDDLHQLKIELPDDVGRLYFYLILFS